MKEKIKKCFVYDIQNNELNEIESPNEVILNCENKAYKINKYNSVIIPDDFEENKEIVILNNHKKALKRIGYEPIQNKIENKEFVNYSLSDNSQVKGNISLEITIQKLNEAIDIPLDDENTVNEKMKAVEKLSGSFGKAMLGLNLKKLLNKLKEEEYEKVNENEIEIIEEESEENIVKSDKLHSANKKRVKSTEEEIEYRRTINSRGKLINNLIKLGQPQLKKENVNLEIPPEEKIKKTKQESKTEIENLPKEEIEYITDDDLYTPEKAKIMRRKVKVPLDVYGNTIEKEVIDQEHIYSKENPQSEDTSKKKGYNVFVGKVVDDMKKEKEIRQSKPSTTTTEKITSEEITKETTPDKTSKAYSTLVKTTVDDLKKEKQTKDSKNITQYQENKEYEEIEGEGEEEEEEVEITTTTTTKRRKKGKGKGKSTTTITEKVTYEKINEETTPDKTSKAYSNLVKKTADDLKKEKKDDKITEKTVKEVIEEPEYAPVYIQHLITQEPDDKIELNKPKITSTNIKIEGFKKIINGKEVKSNPITLKYKKIEKKKSKPKVLVTEEIRGIIPGKESKAYDTFVKETVEDLKNQKEKRDHPVTTTSEEFEIKETKPDKTSKAYSTLVKKTADDLKKEKQTVHDQITNQEIKIEGKEIPDKLKGSKQTPQLKKENVSLEIPPEDSKNEIENIPKEEIEYITDDDLYTPEKAQNYEKKS